MKSQFPVRKLISLNIWLTIYLVLFGFVTNMVSYKVEDHEGILTKLLISSVLLIINSFLNLALLLKFEKHIVNNGFKNNLKFVGNSYLFNAIIYLVIIIGFAKMNHDPIYFSSLIYLVIISILLNTLILAFQNYAILHEAKLNAELENSELRAAHADATSKLLRQQIHPHFLFNALNILKSLYKVNPKAGEEYLVRLSDFLRTAVSSHNQKLIALKDELKFCKDYLEMQKIRFNDALTFSISISDKMMKYGKVPSFSIQPLLENAIKHNELTAEFPLHIQILEDDDRIIVVNNLKLKSVTGVSSGSGLANLAERYRILTGDELIIERNEHSFLVSIKIVKDENSYN